jgi:hypothetical protein
VGQKFSVAGKAVATKKQRALVNRCRRNGIDSSGSTKLDCCLNVSGSRFSCSSRFDSGLNVTTNIVEMKNYGARKVVRNRFTLPDDVVAALQVESAGGVGQ